jgi:hypothetical protein
MTHRRTAVIASGAALFGLLVGQATPVRAQLDRLIKGAAIIALVDRFAPDIDKFANQVLGGKPGPDEDAATKVVPILTVGTGTYAGAAQVTGPTRLVEQVKAVAQIEAEKRIIQPKVRVRGLIPISDRNTKRLENLSRVRGVGISATLEVKL